MDGGSHFTADPVATDWIAVLLLDGFSMLSLGAITEPFALLRQRSPDAGPDLRLAGLTCRGVRSASGVDVTCAMDGADLSAALSVAGAPRAIIVCGFASLTTLAKKFRQTFGMTPSQWRERKPATPENTPDGRGGRQHRPVTATTAGTFQHTTPRYRDPEQEFAASRYV